MGCCFGLGAFCLVFVIDVLVTLHVLAFACFCGVVGFLGVFGFLGCYVCEVDVLCVRV